MLELFFRFPRAVLFLFGVASIIVGWQMLGVVKFEDAPVRRALGASGIPVDGLVADRTTTYPKITTVQYDHAGVRFSEMVMQDPIFDKAVIGTTVAIRLDPQNPNIFVRADKAAPPTTSKRIICLVVIIAGLLLTLGVIYSWIR